MRTVIVGLLITLFVIGLVGCDDTSASGAYREDSVESVADKYNLFWKSESGALVFESRELAGGEAGYGVVSFDLMTLGNLPIEERLRIKKLAVIGTDLPDHESFDFGYLPNLVSLNISGTKLTSLQGLENTQVEVLSLTDVALTDIEFVKDLPKARDIWIRTSESIDAVPDLSALSALTDFAIQANPLKSLNGVETLRAGAKFVISYVLDVSALRNIEKNKFLIGMNEGTRQFQPEVVKQITDLGWYIVEETGL